jgi:hypothetical protein
MIRALLTGILKSRVTPISAERVPQVAPQEMAILVRPAAILVRPVLKVARLAINRLEVTSLSEISLSEISRQVIGRSVAGMTGPHAAKTVDRLAVLMVMQDLLVVMTIVHPVVLTMTHDLLAVMQGPLAVINLGEISLVVTSPMPAVPKDAPVVTALIAVVTVSNPEAKDHAATHHAAVVAGSSQEVKSHMVVVAAASNPAAVLGGIANPCVLLRVG